MMPIEMLDKDEFITISERATECRVHRSKGVVKMKLRTPGKLLTLKLKPNEAEGLIPKLKCPVRDV
jgi:hypothetical protein